MLQEASTVKVVGGEIERAKEGEIEKEVGGSERPGPSKTSTPLGRGKKSSPRKVVRGKWVAKASRERGRKKKERSPGADSFIKSASPGATGASRVKDGCNIKRGATSDIRSWLNGLKKEKGGERDVSAKEEEENQHSRFGEGGEEKERMSGVNESLAELKKSLNSSVLSAPEFDSTTSSIIEEMLELISRIEQTSSWADGSDPDLEMSFVGLVSELTFNNVFQVEDSIGERVKIHGQNDVVSNGGGSWLNSVGGNLTLNKIWTILKEVDRVVGVKRKLSDSLTTDSGPEDIFLCSLSDVGECEEEKCAVVLNNPRKDGKMIESSGERELCLTESSLSGGDHSTEGYSGDVSSGSKVSSVGLCEGLKSMGIAEPQEEIVNVVGYGVVGSGKVVSNGSLVEYLDDCVVLGGNVKRSNAVPGAVPQVLAVANYDELKEDACMLGICKEEARGSPGGELYDDGGRDKHQNPSNGGCSNAKSDYQKGYHVGENTGFGR